MRMTDEELRSVGESIGINFDEVDFEQFKMGYDVELEHGKVDSDTNVSEDDPGITAKIAWAHLKELPDYYTRLKKMEESNAKVPGEENLRKAIKLLATL